MRSHAKAPSVGSIGGGDPAVHRVSWRALLAIVSVLAASVILGATAASGVAPTVSIDAPGSSSYTTVSVSGTVDPEDSETYYAFEASTDGVSWSGFTYLGPLPAGSGPSPVSAELTGLHPGTEYQVRLVANNFIDPEVVSTLPNPTFTTQSLPNPTVSIDPVGSTTDTTAQFSGSIDPEAPAGNPAASNVNWHFECIPACPGLSGSIAADSTSHSVSAQATGLKINTAYEVKLVAENANGPTSSATESFTTGIAGPIVQTFPGFALRGGAKALIGGRINPQNSATTYWLEYGPTDSYGSSIPASHDAGAGAGEELGFVTQEVTGLQPSTTYHYRLVATNAAGTTAGLDKTFTTAPSSSESSIGKLELPDNRAWEMVSPPEKNNTEIWKASAVASESGDALAFKSQGSFAGQPTARGGQITNYLSRRGDSAWSTAGITPPGGEFYSNAGYYAFSSDLRYGIQWQWDPRDRPRLDPKAAPELNFYRADTFAHTFELLNGPTQTGAYAAFSGASADLSRGIFHSSWKLTPDAPCEATGVIDGGNGLCVYEWDHGAVKLGSVLPGEVPSHGTAGALVDGTPQNMMAADGSRFYFANEGHLFVRSNGSSTTQVDVPERATPATVSAGSQFVNAERAHGEKVVFLTTQDLLESDQDEASDLYLYDAGKPAGSRLTLLSQGNVPGAGAGALGVVGNSDSLDKIYFATANQILAGEPDTPGAKVYLWDNTGSQPRLSYVSTLSDSDNDVWQAVVVRAFFWYKQARSSPDGRFLAFLSSARLTAYDNGTKSEIYRYDSQTGELTCASCDPSGAKPQNSSEFNSFQEVDAQGNQLNSGQTPATHLPRNVSSDGSVFFETKDALIPKDSNGQTDVYAYEDGRPYLISAGTGSAGSQFLDASVNGSDVFFTTADALVGWDAGVDYDAYDARVNGGLPEPPPGVIGCDGDACQPPPNPPVDPTPASATFNGKGNNVVKKAKKAKKRQGKHQKKKRSKAKRHHRHTSTRKNG